MSITLYKEFLVEEEKFLKGLERNLKDQINRLNVEELSILKLISSKDPSQFEDVSNHELLPDQLPIFNSNGNLSNTTNYENLSEQQGQVCKKETTGSEMISSIDVTCSENATCSNVILSPTSHQVLNKSDVTLELSNENMDIQLNKTENDISTDASIPSCSKNTSKIKESIVQLLSPINESKEVFPDSDMKGLSSLDNSFDDSQDESQIDSQSTLLGESHDKSQVVKKDDDSKNDFIDNDITDNKVSMTKSAKTKRLHNYDDSVTPTDGSVKKETTVAPSIVGSGSIFETSLKTDQDHLSDIAVNEIPLDLDVSCKSNDSTISEIVDNTEDEEEEDMEED